MRDAANNLNFKVALAPKAAVTDNTAQVSTILDTFNCKSATLALALGTNTDADATFAVLLEESDVSDMTGAAAVADAHLIGTEALAGFTFDDDGEARKLGYVGYKRYIRATVTPTGNNSGNIFLAGLWITEPLSRPTANPPA